LQRPVAASRRVAAFATRLGLFATRHFDCNPLRYKPESCYNPVATMLTDAWNRLHYRAVARPYALIHVNPSAIRWNLRVPPRRWPLGSILDGNWDTAFRRPVDIAWKISTMRQRFCHGMDWEDTDLFQLMYAGRIARVGEVRGAKTLEELAGQYRRVYDPLFEAMRRDGFTTPTLAHPNVTYVYVHIDRNGDFLYTLEGNHRLGMALALGLPTIPVRVVTRHRSWQLVREEVKRAPHGHATRDLGDHPDLQDVRRRS